MLQHNELQVDMNHQIHTTNVN